MNSYIFCPSVCLYRFPENSQTFVYGLNSFVQNPNYLWIGPSAREALGPGLMVTINSFEVGPRYAALVEPFVENAEGSKVPFVYEAASVGAASPSGIFFALGHTANLDPTCMFAFDRQSVFFLAGSAFGLDDAPLHGTSCDFDDATWTPSVEGAIDSDVYVKRLMRHVTDKLRQPSSFRKQFEMPPLWPSEPALCRAVRAYRPTVAARLLSGVFEDVKPNRKLLWDAIVSHGWRFLQYAKTQRNGSAEEGIARQVDFIRPGEACPF